MAGIVGDTTPAIGAPDPARRLHILTRVRAGRPRYRARRECRDPPTPCRGQHRSAARAPRGSARRRRLSDPARRRRLQRFHLRREEAAAQLRLDRILLAPPEPLVRRHPPSVTRDHRSPNSRTSGRRRCCLCRRREGCRDRRRSSTTPRTGPPRSHRRGRRQVEPRPGTRQAARSSAVGP